jgi:hypothetical protein
MNQIFDFENIFGNIYRFFSDLFNPSYHIPYMGTGLKLIFAFFSIFFIFVIAYCFVRLFEIRKKEHKYLKHEIAEYAHKHAEEDRKVWEKGGNFLNKRWDTVLQYLFSENAGDWKLAVIEADSMLDGLMDQLGFKGENLGEKLKSATQENFHSLSSAWEVHIIRNRIAHEGADFSLSQHEAKRVIALYEQIFREFGYI